MCVGIDVVLCVHPCVYPTGSIPSERLQNILRHSHPHIYHCAVDPHIRRSWVRFLERYQYLFVLFETDSGCWRVRWVGHHNWEEADRRSEEDQKKVRSHLRYMISLFLHQNWGECRTVDEFISVYPHLPGNRGPNGEPKIPLPARGDLVRFVRQNHDLFIYNSSSYQIHRAGSFSSNNRSQQVLVVKLIYLSPQNHRIATMHCLGCPRTRFASGRWVSPAVG